MSLLKASYLTNQIEAGCDEAGRGCLSGPVVAAAVILPEGFDHDLLNDSKKLSPVQRDKMRLIIMDQSISYGVGLASPEEIDQINILNASFLAMHRAIEKLKTRPGLLLIDGNRFTPFPGIKHICIVSGDALYRSIAAASILAKTYRDELMADLHQTFPEYNWKQNKGYPTIAHKTAISEYGFTPHHRLTFNAAIQTRLDF
ncbi:MAG: ribonuclease HII [Bacteroidales bacterium]